MRGLDLLTVDSRQLAALASVIGERFDFSLLQAITGRDDAALLSSLKELIAAQLVAEETAERFRFRHALTRQAVYAELLTRERQQLFAPATSTDQTFPRLPAHGSGKPWLSLLDGSPLLGLDLAPDGAFRFLAAGLRASASASTSFALTTSLPHPTPTQLRSHLASSRPTALHLPDLVSSWPALSSWTLDDGLTQLREAVGEDMGVDVEMGPRGRGYLDERYRRVTMGFGERKLLLLRHVFAWSCSVLRLGSFSLEPTQRSRAVWTGLFQVDVVVPAGRGDPI